MAGALRPLEHTVIGDLLEQVVLKRVLAGPVGGRCIAPHDQLLAQQHGQCVRRGRVDGSQDLVREHVADHSGLLKRGLFVRAQRVQTNLQHPGQRGRDADLEQPVRQHVPALRVGGDHAVVDQHFHQFFHVERVALCATGDQRLQRRRHLRDALQQHIGQLVAVGLVQWRQPRVH